MASAPVASVRLAFPLAVAATAAMVWYLWSNQGTAHGVSLETKAFAPMSYEPYAWWMTHRTSGFVRNYPDRVGPNCLDEPLESQTGSVSTRNQEESPYG